VIFDPGIVGESTLASFNAFGADIHEEQLVTQPGQELRPASEAWSNFKDRMRGDE